MGRVKISTNESVSVGIAEGLKRRGVEACSARDAGNLGLTDEEQLIYACKEKLSIFTHDTDFLQIAAGWLDKGRTHQGIIYCHQKRYSIGECVRKLRVLTSLLSSEDMVDGFVKSRHPVEKRGPGFL
jgi:predicted nuclease of predicted toxin-antitoxin system